MSLLHRCAGGRTCNKSQAKPINPMPFRCLYKFYFIFFLEALQFFSGHLHETTKLVFWPVVVPTIGSFSCWCCPPPPPPPFPHARANLKSCCCRASLERLVSIYKCDISAYALAFLFSFFFIRPSFRFFFFLFFSFLFFFFSFQLFSPFVRVPP